MNTAAPCNPTVQSDEELQQLVEQISLRFFQRRFVHKAFFNSRLRTTGGRYHLNSHHIDFNPKVLAKYGMDELIGVIKHELCHYHLHLAGMGYQHKDQDFKRLLKQTGGSRFVQPLSEPTKQSLHSYRCQDCQTLIQRRRRINTARYVCGKCQGKLIVVA